MLLFLHDVQEWVLDTIVEENLVEFVPLPLRLLYGA